MIVEINKDNFESEVINYEGQVIVDFYGTWCMPCKMLSPTLEKIVNQNTDIKLAKVDIDENEDLVKEFGITSVPTLIIYKNGVQIERIIGLKSEASILEYLK